MAGELVTKLQTASHRITNRCIGVTDFRILSKKTPSTWENVRIRTDIVILGKA